MDIRSSDLCLTKTTVLAIFYFYTFLALIARDTNSDKSPQSQSKVPCNINCAYFAQQFAKIAEQRIHGADNP